MEPQKMWLSVLNTIKTIWKNSWQSLWNGEKKLFPVAIIGYGAILALMVAVVIYIGFTNQTGKPFSLHGISTHIVDVIIGLLLFLLVGNFVMAAVIARAYAWLNKDQEFAAKTWHIAHRTFFKLFAVHVCVLALDIGVQTILIKLAGHTPSLIHTLIGIVGFIIYMTILAVPFVTYTAIVGESMPVGKALSQGIKLLFNSWSYILSVMILSIFLPSMLLFSLMQVPVLNSILAIFILFFFYPFLLVVIGFTNIIVYQQAKHNYYTKMANKGIDIRQA